MSLKFGNKFLLSLSGRGRLYSSINSTAPLDEAISPLFSSNLNDTHKTMIHFSKILTKHGKRGDDIVAQVNQTLRHKYRRGNVIQIALDAIKPTLKYVKYPNTRKYIPMLLTPRSSLFIGMKWIIEQANAKKYERNRPDLVRGLTDELNDILQGTSSLFTKRIQFHKNPN